MNRRSFLKALGGLTGGLVVHRALGETALGSTLTGLPDATGASRYSKLGGSLVLVHSDLHNHSIMSGDAQGEPADALQQIRDRGIDVACLTEHAVSGKDHGQYTCANDHQQGGCRFVTGINGNDWQRMAEIANAGNDELALKGPDPFVVFRGFEYSTPTIGHINVWFSSEYTDPAHEGALATPRAASEMWRVFPPTKPIAEQFEKAPDTAQILPFYEWLASAPGSPVLGGGSDAVACFNHPGYFGNFQDFVFHGGAADYMVAIEAFNPINNDTDNPISNDADYFWYGSDRGLPNPFNACFNAGWRVGFTGVSDEHSGHFGQANKGRGGLWVPAVTRGGVRQALESRRTFATMEPALRLDAMANGVPMGSSMPATDSLTIQLDIARDAGWVGKEITVEVVGPGTNGPSLLSLQERVPVPADDQPPITFTIGRQGAAWMFLRIVDPDLPNHQRATAPFANGKAFAYASPWFFD